LKTINHTSYNISLLQKISIIAVSYSFDLLGWKHTKFCK